MISQKSLSTKDVARNVIAKGTLHWILIPLVLSIIVGALSVFNHLMWGILIAFSLLLLSIFFAFFFRDPEREIGDGIISPADGSVGEIDLEERRVSIVMGLRHVHVNRSPAEGVVTSISHEEGSHIPAFRKKSRENEKVHITLRTEFGEVEVLQIAGMVARRIISYLEEGSRVKKGQRIGIIRFGSRVDIILPQKARIVLRKGMKTRAGETTIAEVTHEVDCEDLAR